MGSLIISAFRSHGLDPNLKRNKTSVMIGVRGKGAKVARRNYFDSGRPELALHDLRESIPVVPHYKHLGCVVDIGVRLHLEARYRTACATAAYDKAKELLLHNRDLTLATRSSLFQSVVVSTYYNLEVWIAQGRHWESMSDAFSRLVRRLLCRDVKGEDLFRIPLPMAHWATGCWTLDMFARRSRISALVSLTRRAPPILWRTRRGGVRSCSATYDGSPRGRRNSGQRRVKRHGRNGGTCCGSRPSVSSAAPTEPSPRSSASTRSRLRSMYASGTCTDSCLLRSGGRRAVNSGPV